MKRIRLILAACLALIVLYNAHAENAGDTARAAARRVTAETANTTSRQQTPNSNNATTSRTGATTTHNTTNGRGRTNTNNTRSTGVTERTTSRTTNVVSRTAPVATQNTVARTAVAQKASRTATRTPVTTATTQNRATRTVARTVAEVATREDMLNRDYSKCKTVFYDCMDEFCANKDAQLKRCACSSRIHEFDKVKQQLANVEEKMLDFNQRLLTVSMEKEDAAALSVATEGETAYYAGKDTSASKKTLDAIAKKLNTSFDSSNFNTDLNVLTWSLNADSAFDNVDSLMGASTTTKSGTALYSAALPVCREMAAEVCSASDLKIAEGGYQATIEQDCNTVAKTYKSQTDQARSKVLEGGALLDMSRLNVHQQRNSDDILTCKSKMLDMLTNSTVCGEGLGKCLDITGQYINPSTGEAVLTTNLINLANLLTRPADNQTWSGVASNGSFVSFLNTKKKFLEPAMEQCQDIADDVWNAFVEDALAQIKLAQEAKMEEVRQSCTSLTSQCLADAAETITDFDARALSTFGIAANQTAQAMCTNVINACTALLETTQVATGDNTWEQGVAEIATTTAYETMMQTCRQVGRACIIQVCTSTSGNFGLCESIAHSTNRKSIINHTACWQQVKDCIESTGTDTLDQIMVQLGKGNVKDKQLNFYADMYTGTLTTTTKGENQEITTCINNTNSNCVYDICADVCTSTTKRTTACTVCRLAENIWGNCEVPPDTVLDQEYAHNIIKQPLDATSTLLYWFAVNTGTDNMTDSCRDTTCGVGYIAATDSNGITTCRPRSSLCFTAPNDDTIASCGADSIRPLEGKRCQCCETKDYAGNCCFDSGTITINGRTYCAPSGSQAVTEPYTVNGTTQRVLLCAGGTMQRTGSNLPRCTGKYVTVDINTSTNTLRYKSPTCSAYVKETFMSENGQCTFDGTTWKTAGNETCATPSVWSVIFNPSASCQ